MKATDTGAKGIGVLKLLLIEDNQHMRSILTAVLKGAGMHNVRHARDGAEALDVLRQYPADLALIDFNMAPLNGIEFTQMLRRSTDSANPYLPVIMITGHTERSRVLEARDAGINEFVVKPLVARTLISRITTIIEKPRDFVKSSSYFGPDRRRKKDAKYSGERRRASDQKQAEPEG